MLKTNDYRFKDSNWCYRRLSREESLTLTKSISIYWHSLAYIPKGMVEKIKKKCFSFLWSRKGEREGIPLAKWNKIENPKEVGAWGLNNIHYFGQALAKKFFGNL